MSIRFPSQKILFSNTKMLFESNVYIIYRMKFYPWKVISVVPGPVMNYFKILSNVNTSSTRI